MGSHETITGAERTQSAPTESSLISDQRPPGNLVLFIHKLFLTSVPLSSPPSNDGPPVPCPVLSPSSCGQVLARPASIQPRPLISAGTVTRARFSRHFPRSRSVAYVAIVYMRRARPPETTTSGLPLFFPLEFLAMSSGRTPPGSSGTKSHSGSPPQVRRGCSSCK